MKKRYLYSLTAAAAAFVLAGAGTGLAQETENVTETAAETVEGGVEVKANEASKTGYTATFTYYNDDAANVQIMGGFTFYRSGDEYVYSAGKQNEDGDIVDTDEHIYTPENWEPGLCRFGDAGYIKDMTRDDETGAWTISVDLPCGSYLYQYIVTDEDGNEETITDPANIPYCNTLGASQVRSQFYVPFDAEKQDASDDWTFVFPAEEEEDRGTLIWETYDGVTYEGSSTAQQQVEIYLPAHYDADREEPYKVLYLAHGGGGEEGDWFHQGNAGNIMDRLAEQGVCDEFVMVAMDVSSGTDEELCRNLKDYTLPYIEANYNVSTEPDGRALAGLSKGAKFTYVAYGLISDTFGYFGAFSVAYPTPKYHIADAVNLNKAKLYLGGGYADQTMTWAYEEGGTPMIESAKYLDENNIEYTGLNIVEGGHDWFTWPQLLRDFISNFLWK